MKALPEYVNDMRLIDKGVVPGIGEDFQIYLDPITETYYLITYMGEDAGWIYRKQTVTVYDMFHYLMMCCERGCYRWTLE